MEYEITMQITKENRIKSIKHRKNMARDNPCVICGNPDVQIAHVSFPCLKYGKGIKGIGTKACDMWTLPLCVEHHRQQTNTGEQTWWEEQGYNPIEICIELAKKSKCDEVRKKASSLK